jgi:hypothetical protein
MTRHVESSDVRHSPELVRSAEQVRTAGWPEALRIASEEVGAPLPPRPATRTARGRRRSTYLRSDDTFWDLVGMYVAPGASTDVAGDKHRYLAEAYAAKDE